jgi:hypothetical protein
MIGTYLTMIHNHWIDGYELQVALIKLVVISFVYAQYHFATKNYYVSSDMLHKYEHLAVISKTMTDFIAATFDDDILKENVLSNASKTLFSELRPVTQNKIQKKLRFSKILSTSYRPEISNLDFCKK